MAGPGLYCISENHALDAWLVFLQLIRPWAAGCFAARGGAVPGDKWIPMGSHFLWASGVNSPLPMGKGRRDGSAQRRGSLECHFLWASGVNSHLPMGKGRRDGVAQRWGSLECHFLWANVTNGYLPMGKGRKDGVAQRRGCLECHFLWANATNSRLPMGKGRKDGSAQRRQHRTHQKTCGCPPQVQLSTYRTYSTFGSMRNPPPRA